MPGKRAAPTSPRRRPAGSGGVPEGAPPSPERALRLFAHLVASDLPGSEVRVESRSPGLARGTVRGAHAGHVFEAAFVVEDAGTAMGEATYRIPHARVLSNRRLPFEEEAFRDEVVRAFRGDNTHAALADFAIDRVFVCWEGSLPVLDPGLVRRLREGLDALDAIRARHTPRLPPRAVQVPRA